MNKKRIWLVIPTALLPYLVLCSFAVIFFSANDALCKFIIDRIFAGNGLLLIATLLIFSLIATVLSVICFLVSIRKKLNALSLAKTAMIIKLLQVPAYILIFIISAIFLTTIFAIPFSLGLLLLDCLTLILTGLLTFAAAVNAVCQQIVTRKNAALVVALQLVFCADVVASILFFFSLKKRIKSS